MFNDPSDLLKTYLRENVCIRLSTEETIRGRLKAFDEHLSVLISTATETIFIRGENIVCVSMEIDSI